MTIQPKDISAGAGLVRAVIDGAIRIADARGERVVIVGGVVRDLVMKRPVGDYDLDLVVEGDGLEFSKALQLELGGERREHVSFLTSKLFAPFARVLGDGALLSEVDIATARSEEYERPGALPVVKPTSLEKDLWRRDFSSNALALPLSVYRDFLSGAVTAEALPAHVIDPCGGLTDIASRTVRILHPQSFIDDPTRLFRAIRYLVRLSFNLERATFAGFYEAVRGGALATLSPRRVWNEVVTALGEESPAEVLLEFVDRGLFSHFPIIENVQADDVIDALSVMTVHRSLVSTGVFIEAGKLVVLAFLVGSGREDIAQATSEGSRMIRRAKAAFGWDGSSTGGFSPADLLAAYSLSREESLLRALRGGKV